MSSYQYYDFYSIDRPLSQEELNKVANLSSRVNPTPRRATFEYNYSDFRYDEEQVLNEFFDMMLYMANWGTFRLMMKFPQDLVSYEELKKYEIEADDEFVKEIRVFKTGDNVLVDMNYSFEGGYWMDGEGVLDGMLPLRNQVLNGDYRVLYIGWLFLADFLAEMQPEIQEPPVPANLSKLDHSLESFMNFWEINHDLISAAAEFSEEEESISDQELQSQIVQLTEEEKNQFLTELIVHEVRAKNTLRKRLIELHFGPKQTPRKNPRTLAEIMEATEKHEKERLEKERKKAEDAHRQKMARIEKEESNLLKELMEHAELKSAKGYERATEILADLKEYHEFINAQDLFRSKLRRILDKYGHSAAFRRRMKAKDIL